MSRSSGSKSFFLVHFICLLSGTIALCSVAAFRSSASSRWIVSATYLLSKIPAGHSGRPLQEQSGAHDMSAMHHEGSAHVRLTHSRTPSLDDLQKAESILRQLRAGITKYKDYHVALDEGFQIFLPDVPQSEYHFTSYKNALNERGQFDPSRPASLLYKKIPGGYELVGGMYTMPRSATEDELNERVPLSVGTWHLHISICLPPKSQGPPVDWTRFGGKGSIATKEACDAADGTFLPFIFGWMVHVYPFEDSVSKAFAMHHSE